MSKDSKEYKEAREKIAKEIAIIRGLISWEFLPDKKVETQFNRTIINGYASKEGCFEYADSILSLKSDSGKDLIAVVADDQRLPKNPFPHKRSHIVQYTAFAEGQNSMVGFVRVV